MNHLVLLAIVLGLFGIARIDAQPLPEIEYEGGARSHSFDVIDISLDISFDMERELVFGRVVHQIRSLNPALALIRLDAAPEIIISSMKVDGDSAEYTHIGDDLFIVLPQDIPYNDTFLLSISYSVSPEKGLYFVKKEPNERDGRDQIWTQGEGEDHHYWIPMYDYPNDLVTSEIRATVQSDWSVLSNGKLVSRESLRRGETTWSYRMDKPHAPYLMMFAAGEYLVTHDTVRSLSGDIPLEYWSYPDFPERVEPTFGNTKDIFLYLENLLGVPYPWNKYSQIMIDEFMYGGMENTTATTLNDISLVDEKMRLDYNPDGLIAHELAHQWFGDLVTNRSWDHLWIHESFATYLAARYIGHKYGQDAYDALMDRYARGAVDTDRDQGRSPIASGGGYTANIYGRGAFVLHMLNRMLGEELFRRSIRHFLEKHAHSVVQTNDLKLAFEDVTGYNLDWFFQQWIYGAGMPDLIVRPEYANDTLKICVEQRQERDSLTGTFRLPVTVDVYYGNPLVIEELRPAPVSEFLWLRDSVDTLIIATASEPWAVLFDAGNYAMKQLEYERAPSQLLRQLLVAENSVDRVEALRALVLKSEEEFQADPGPVPHPYGSVGEMLLHLFQHDSAAWVREHIISTAANLRLGNAPEIIAAGLTDPEKDVRAAAVANVWAIKDTLHRVELLRPMLADSSAEVAASALEMIAATDTEGLHETLEQFQYVEGRREQTARAWIGAVAAGKFNAFADRVAWYAVNGSRYGTRRKAFETLAVLDTTTVAVRDAILAGLQAEGDGMFDAALEAVKAHGDAQMEAMIAEIAYTFSDERRERLSKLF